MNEPLKTQLRLPPDLHQQIVDARKSSGRSMNAEIVQRLQDSFAEQTVDPPGELFSQSNVYESFAAERLALAAELLEKGQLSESSERVLGELTEQLEFLLPLIRQTKRNRNYPALFKRVASQNFGEAMDRLEVAMRKQSTDRLDRLLQTFGSEWRWVSTRATELPPPDAQAKDVRTAGSSRDPSDP